MRNVIKNAKIAKITASTIVLLAIVTISFLESCSSKGHHDQPSPAPIPKISLVSYGRTWATFDISAKYAKTQIIMVNYNKVIPVDTGRYTLHGLNADKKYTVVLAASNKYGTIEDKVSFRTEP